MLEIVTFPHPDRKRRLLLGICTILDVAVLTIGAYRWSVTRFDKIRDLEVHTTVLRVYPYDIDLTDWCRAELSDGQDIPLESGMEQVLRPGDSLFKKKGESSYLLKRNSGAIRRFDID